MIIRTLSKAIVRLQANIIQFNFARRIKSNKNIEQPQQPILQIASSSQQAQINYQKWQQNREKNILSVDKRAAREEDQQLEREIVRLMDQDKTDQQIIEQLSKRNQNQSTQSKAASTQHSQNPFKGKENFFRRQLGLTTKLDMPQTLEYQQMAMFEHIKKETKRQTELRGKFYKNKKEIEGQQNQQGNNIPDEFIQDVESYKNKELKYLADLVESKKPTGKGITQRRQKEYTKSPRQEIVIANDKIGPTDVVEVESNSQKVQRLTSNYEKASQMLSSEDNFIKKGEEDLKLSEKNSNLYLREDIGKLMKEYEPKNSFSVQQSRVNSFNKMLINEGLPMSIEQIKKIEKDTLFESKKNLEELQLFRKRLERRLKRKKIKELSQKINQEEFTDKHETKELYKPLDFDLKKHRLRFDMVNEEKINEINKNYARSMFSPESRKVDHLELHTEYNIKQWIWQQLIDGSENRIAPVFDRIVVDKIHLNNSNTTVTIHWQFGTKIKSVNEIDTKENENDEEIQKVQGLLEKASAYMSGKMCQDLQLRFGPLIKFKHKRANTEAEKAHKEMLREMPIIIKEKLKDEVAKGVLPARMKEKDLYKVITTMETSYEQKIGEINYSTAQEKPQKRTKKEKVRNNRNQDGSRKKKPKKVNAADQFWNEL